MENEGNKNKFFLTLFFIMVVATGIFLLTSNKKIDYREQGGTDSSSQQTVPTAQPTKGLISLKVVSGGSLISPVSIALTADSDGENITAFDTLISYDLASLDFVKADSNNPNFTVYTFKKDKHLTLMVVKTGPGNVPTIFKGETVATLIFQPKVKGSFTFTVLPSSEKETTKFVNEKTEVIYPSRNGIEISVN